MPKGPDPSPLPTSPDLPGVLARGCRRDPHSTPPALGTSSVSLLTAWAQGWLKRHVDFFVMEKLCSLLLTRSHGPPPPGGIPGKKCGVSSLSQFPLRAASWFCPETPGPQPPSWGSKFPRPPSQQLLTRPLEACFPGHCARARAAGEAWVSWEEGASLPDRFCVLGSLPHEPSLRGLCTESDSGKPGLVHAEQTTACTSEEAHERCVTFSFLVTSILALSSSIRAVARSGELGPLGVPRQLPKQKDPKLRKGPKEASGPPRRRLLA